MEIVNYRTKDPNLKLELGTEFSSGYDIKSNQKITIKSGKIAVITTGIF